MVPLILLAALAFFLTLHWFLSPSKLPAQAESEKILFEGKFSRAAGPPNIFTETVYLPANVGPPFHLHIENGLANGTKRISSATLTLNGVQVVSPSEFSQRVAIIEKEVDLHYGWNTLEISLASKPGALITVNITGTVTIPPSLDAVDPDTGITGQRPYVILFGSNTHFQHDVTEARFGPNISVGGGPEGGFGPVAVQQEDPTIATADITISPTAAFGPRTVTVRTGAEEVSKADAFTVLAPGPIAIAETTVSTIAGSGDPGFADGQGTDALFDSPRGIGRDMHGNIYVADTNNHVIRKITPGGRVIALAGSGIPGLVNGMGTAAQFHSPEGVVAGPDGTVYVADTHNHAIRKIAATDGMVTILAGTGIAGFQDGPGSTARFDTPRSIALRWDGVLVVGDEGNNRVRLVLIDPDTGDVTVSTLAGSGIRGFQDGDPWEAQFASLAAVSADADNNVYVADSANQRIRKITPDGIVSTFAGTGAFGFADGPALNAQFADPSGVTVDRAGNVYVADTFNSLIRRITTQGWVETVAGTGVRGADDGPGTAATHTPQGLVTGSAVFIADTGNHKIRLVEVGPIITGLDPNSGVQDSTVFPSLTVTGTNLAGANNLLTFLKDGVADTGISVSNLIVNPEGTELTASVTIASTAALGPRVVTVTTPSGTSSDMASAANTFTVLGKLILSPDPIIVARGEDQPLTVSILNLAPADGVSVTLTSAGPATATVTSDVTIAEGETSTTATVTGVKVGGTTITASANGFKDETVVVNVTIPVPEITSFDPGSGEIGDTVTITGTGFGPTPGDNTVSFTGDNDTRVNTPAISASGTQLIVAVPEGAVNGPLQVVTDGGTATSTGNFIVLSSPDFTLAVVPDSVQVIEGSEVSFSISATGEDGFTGLIALAVGSLPNGLTASFAYPQIAPGGVGTLTIAAADGAGSGAFTVTGTSVINGTVRSRQQTVSVQVSAAGITALRGRVLDIDLNPVLGVTLTLNNNTAHSTTTDAAGNFLLQNVPAGADQFLFIDGSTAIPDRKYPTFPALVTIREGQVNTLPFLPFLHPQKATGFVDISNSSVERVVTDPDLPGVELRIPAGVRIVGWDGQANTKVSVRTVDLDRMPLPHPDPPIAARSAYFFYFDKVGGGTPLDNAGAVKPVPFTAPNDLGLPPGAQAELWYYDEGPTLESAEHRWKLAGMATVSDDGTTISTDPGVGLPRFCCGAACFACRSGQCAAADRPRREGSSQGGEPVDLNTGVFVLDKTDMVIPARIPLSVTRTYRTLESAAGIFGIGWSANFDIALRRSGNQITLVLPGSTEIPFSLQTDGSYAPVSDPGHLGSRVTVAANGSATHRSKDGTQMTFPAFIQNFAQLRSIVDRNGNTMTVSRDSVGRITAISDDAGRQITFEYSSALGPVSRIQDPLGRTVQYEYDQNRLVRVTDPKGGVTRYTYDAQGRMVSVKDPREITFLTNHYSASGRVIRQVEAGGGEWHFAYMLSGAQVTGPGCPGPTCPEVESLDTIQHGFTFQDGFVVATMLTDPRGDTTTYRFNNFGDLIEQIDALGQSIKFERAFGTNLLLSTTDPLGRVTRFTYDGNGNVETITDLASHVRTFTYEPAFNKLTSITDPLGNVTQFAYDTDGNLISITDPLGNVTQIGYNEFGQPIATTDPLGNVTQFEYDAQGDLATIIDPLGNTTTRTYDMASRLIAQTDPRRKRTRFSYDELNRITEIVDALQGVTSFTYDGNGNLLTVTDARGSVTSHTYDSMDRLAMRTDPLGREEFYQYDLNGNLIQFTNRKNQVSTFTYDPLDRRTRSDFADGTFTQFTFDAAGRLIRASDSQTGTIVEEYDVLDRLIRETTPQGTVSYAYDPLGRRTTMTVDGQSPVAYTYDAASRLRSITQSPLSPVTIDYDTLGRRTLLTLPNAVSTEYQYDPASRLTALIYRNAFGPLGDLTYEYDPAGNRTGVGGSFARTLLPDPILTSAYDAANQQLTFGDKTMTFDANGNLETITDPTGTTNFTWDARNRLVVLSGPTVSASFQYDGLGRRTQKVTDAAMTTYHYDGADIIRDVLNGNEVVYLRSLNIDEPFTRTDTSANTVLAYLADALGSTVALADPSGALPTTYTYEPFGRTIVDGTFSANSFQFTGRENDGMGSYAYRARYYNPLFHRFISEDPFLQGESPQLGRTGQLTRRPPWLLGFVVGNTQNLNTYGYVRNSPGNFRDPSGCDPSDVCQRNARRALTACLVTSLYAIGIAEAIALTGCAFTGPGLAVPCTITVLAVFEVPTLAAIVACSLAFNKLQQQCSR